MASVTDHLSKTAVSTHPALQVPEIVRMICHRGTNKDIVRLASTCQDLFHIAIPIAWEKVKGVSQLIKLIRNVVVDKEKDLLEDFMITTIEFSGPPKEEHLDRWYMYAPFVRQLEIFEDNSPYFYIPTFPALLSYSRKKVLLPNLTKLVLNPKEPQVMNYLFWVNVLGSSSLRILQASYQSGPMPIVSNDRESTVMQAIVERCPNLTTLGFFSYPYAEPVDNEYDKIFMRYPQPMQNFLPKATSLTNLIGSVSFLLPQSLDTLSRLPNLERLEIHYPQKSTREDIDGLGRVTLPSTAFPRLRQLVLCNLIQYGADFIWDLQPLVHKLAVVGIKFNPYPRRQQNEWALRKLIPTICERSPSISELLLDFDCDSQEGIGLPHMCKFDDTVFNTIARLPLTRLEIMHARLDGPDVVFKLTRTWPNLEVLRWTAQHVKVQELQEFAAFLPRLKHLGVEVNMTPLPEDVDMAYVANIKRQEMRTLESGLHKFSDFTGNDAARIYWYLSVMWPNARLETRSSHLDALPGRKLDLFCVNVVNHMEPLVLDMQSVVGLPPDNFSNGIYDDAVQNYVRVMWDVGCKLMRPQLEKINAPWRMLPAEALSA
ncbi:unnamed protein product [Rhizoctonia solani]|uniref:F-box domain-containing protein n=1 Tax=Rhizoctonia solani TaxID=456999 RepID=A0A8H3HIT5_9AGAM|nr:unnamed protein product [Rhizoctonia solani]